MKPGLPIAVTTTRPRQPRISSTASTKAPFSRDSSEAIAFASVRSTFFAHFNVSRARRLATRGALAEPRRTRGYSKNAS